MRIAIVSCLLLLFAWSCSSSEDDMMAERAKIMITIPTSLPTFSTTASSLTIGGTLTGLSFGDFFSAAGVTNGTNGASVGIDLTGTSWETFSAIPLSPGENEIVAFGDFNSGFVFDEIIITRN